MESGMRADGSRRTGERESQPKEAQPVAHGLENPPTVNQPNRYQLSRSRYCCVGQPDEICPFGMGRVGAVLRMMIPRNHGMFASRLGEDEYTRSEFAGIRAMLPGSNDDNGGGGAARPGPEPERRSEIVPGGPAGQNGARGRMSDGPRPGALGAAVSAQHLVAFPGWVTSIPTSEGKGGDIIPNGNQSSRLESMPPKSVNVGQPVAPHEEPAPVAPHQCPAFPPGASVPLISCAIP